MMCVYGLKLKKMEKGGLELVRWCCVCMLWGPDCEAEGGRDC